MYQWTRVYLATREADQATIDLEQYLAFAPWRDERVKGVVDARSIAVLLSFCPEDQRQRPRADRVTRASFTIDAVVRASTERPRAKG